MLEFENQNQSFEQEEIPMPEDLREMAVHKNQALIVTPEEFARTAQYRTLLMTLRSATGGESYDLEKVARHVVATFNELEGAGC